MGGRRVGVDMARRREQPDRALRGQLSATGPVPRRSWARGSAVRSGRGTAFSHVERARVGVRRNRGSLDPGDDERRVGGIRARQNPRG